MAARTNLLRAFRWIHLYFGVWIAPALIFFAFTGALQTFGLHENSRNGSYKAPHWAILLGQIHKKQAIPVSNRMPPAATPPLAGIEMPQHPGPTPARPGSPLQQQPARHALPLKIFFLLVCVGLVTSSLTGIYMAFRVCRNKVTIIGLLLAGLLLPLVLLLI